MFCNAGSDLYSIARYLYFVTANPLKNTINTRATSNLPASSSLLNTAIIRQGYVDRST